MKANHASLPVHAGFLLLSAALLITLSACDPYFFGPQAGYGGGYGGGYNRSYAPSYGRSNYIYYPQHSTYYHPQTQMYHYHNGSSWVSGPRPYGVAPATLRVAPSVPLYLPSHPQYHHSGVSQNYPHNWSSSGNNNWQQHEGRHDWDHR